MGDQYDLTEDQKNALAARTVRRLALRNEFLKLQSDPSRHGQSEGGTVFDPAIQRFQAMQINQYEHFRPTPKNITWLIMMVVVPMVGYGTLIQYHRLAREEDIRHGNVAYRDRIFKFVG